MKKITLPKDYSPKLSLLETEIAIKSLKDIFEKTLAEELSLLRVSAPLFVKRDTGLNDTLNGIERPVGFEFEDGYAEIVHSLAKWKRMALARYGFGERQGLYTDMNAIRRDETLDALHSIYVDQWDWERIIPSGDRTLETLKVTVESIFRAFKKTERHIISKYPELSATLPDEITFVGAQELEDMYPHLSPKQREDAIAREKKAVFITQIGGRLNSGEPHDGRAADYDDWTLNGDLIFWHETLSCALELSSMGIRVDPTALKYQLGVRDALDKLDLPYHKALVAGELPQTIGGGIGQSRLCMFFLEKAHIGEVQASLWDEATLSLCSERGIPLL